MRFRLNCIRRVPVFGLTLLLAACAAPPKSPTVDESLKRPANSPAALELQVCKTELHNTRLAANESARMAETTAALLEQLAAVQQALVAAQVQPAMPATSTPISASTVTPTPTPTPPSAAANPPTAPTKPATRKHHGR
jgi:hypothetical protein